MTESSKNERTEPSILHVDMDAFFASVEAIYDPKLAGIPLIVGGDGPRGVVASCSYEARFYGVRSAMPSTQARRLCPHAVFVSGDFRRYEEYSSKMHAVFNSITPIVEGISLDEAFLDVAGAVRLFGRPEKIAWQVKERLYSELKLHASVGVATTKHMAKLASVAAKPRASKNGPDGAKGVFVVLENEALDFLHPLPVRALWGVGPAAVAKLERIGVTKVGELARLSLEQLECVLGVAHARQLFDLAWNRDERKVEPERPMKSVGHEQTYVKDLTDREAVHQQLVRLSDAVSTRLRKSKVAGRTVSLKVRFSTFETITRSRTLKKPTSNSGQLLRVSQELMDSVDLESGIRLLGLSVSKFEPMLEADVEQLSFGQSPSQNEAVLDEVIDMIRDRYGESAVMPAPLAGAGGSGVLRPGERQWGPGKDSSGKDS